MNAFAGIDGISWDALRNYFRYGFTLVVEMNKMSLTKSQSQKAQKADTLHPEPESVEVPSNLLGAPHGLLALPHEILINVLAFLSQRELCVFSGVSQECKGLAYDPLLWITFAPVSDKGADSFAHLPALCPSLTALDFSDCPTTLSNRLLIAFAGQCPGLRRLSAPWSHYLCDEGVSALAVLCPKLTDLNLEGSQLLCGEDFASIQGLKELTSLNLSHCWLTPEAVTLVFPALTSLQELNLEGCCIVTDDNVATIVSKCGALTSLRLDAGPVGDDDDFLTDSSVQCIARSLPNIQLLHIGVYNRFTDLSLLALRECQHLLSLRLRGPEFTAQGLRGFFGARNWSELSAMDLTGCGHIDDETCQLIARNCPRLLLLNIALCFDVTDTRSLALITGLPLLTQLGLEGLHQLLDTAICTIPSHLRLLNWLCLTKCDNISGETIQFLVSSIPGITVLDCKNVPHGNAERTFQI